MSPKIFRGRVGDDKDATFVPSFRERQKELPAESRHREDKPTQGQAATLVGLVAEITKLRETRNGDPMLTVVLNVSRSKFRSALRKCVAFGDVATRIAASCSVGSRLTVGGIWRISANNTASKRWVLTIKTAQCPSTVNRATPSSQTLDKATEAILLRGEQDRLTPIVKGDLNKLLRTFGERELR